MEVGTEDKFRCCGRSTRMMREVAKAAAREMVVLVGHTEEYADRLRKSLPQELRKSIHVYGMGMEEVDMERLEIRGFRGPVFFDHFAIYRQYRRVIDEWGKHIPEECYSDRSRYVLARMAG